MSTICNYRSRQGGKAKHDKVANVYIGLTVTFGSHCFLLLFQIMDPMKYNSYLSGLYGGVTSASSTEGSEGEGQNSVTTTMAGSRAGDNTSSRDSADYSPKNASYPAGSEQRASPYANMHESAAAAAGNNNTKTNYSADSLSRSYFDSIKGYNESMQQQHMQQQQQRSMNGYDSNGREGGSPDQHGDVKLKSEGAAAAATAAAAAAAPPSHMDAFSSQQQAALQAYYSQSMLGQQQQQAGTMGAAATSAATPPSAAGLPPLLPMAAQLSQYAAAGYPPSTAAAAAAASLPTAAGAASNGGGPVGGGGGSSGGGDYGRRPLSVLF